jgi:Tfp pilus assembly protein PilX
MTTFERKHVRRSERGIALFIAIFTLLLITAIAAGMIMLTNTDSNISANFRDEQTAFFAAKAGLEEVRDRMRVNAVDSTLASISLNYPTSPGVQVLPGAASPNSAPPLMGQAGGVVYITNPLNGESDTPWNTTGSAYGDDEICAEAAKMSTGTGCSSSPPRPRGTSNWYTAVSANSTYASNPVQPWKWVRITVKTNLTSSGTTATSTVDNNTSHTDNVVCWNGTNELTVSSGSCASAGAALVPAQNYTPVYVLTALAVTPSGSRRMVQMDVATDTLPNIPGAMVMDGPALAANFGPGSSNAFQALGADHAPIPPATTPYSPQNGTVCPPPGGEPALGAYNAASAAPLTGLPGSFTGPPDRSGNYTGVPGNVANVSTQLGDGGMNTVQGLNQLVSVITASAIPANTYSTVSAALTNPGTVNNPVVNVVTGNATINNLTGSGILLVQGNLTLSGMPNYNGVILVIGTGNVSLSGMGHGVLDGAMLVANLYNSTNQLITSVAPGIPNITFSGGGTMTVQYDSCWVAAMNQMTPYKSLGVREMAY